ncbi:hypothetical protein BDK51DRAFT_18482, partial [Blyttiomyces helicus]
FKLDPDLDLARVATQCSLQWTGADLNAVCSDALLNAVVRTVDAVEAGGGMEVSTLLTRKPCC